MRKKHRSAPIKHRGVNIISKGSSHSYWRDPYHLLLIISWHGFLASIAFAYVIANALFALAYLAGGDCIANARPGSFNDAFFFSVQTMASIGYGAMYPRTEYANVVVAIEALVGLSGLAMGTGLMFARFSRPTAKVLFSRVAVISLYEGVPALMFRSANLRGNQIYEAQLRVALARDEFTAEGQFIRRLHDLKLIRSQHPLFVLSWTAIHLIDQTSPLYGMTPQSLAETESIVIVTLTGLDETVSQTVYVRYSYSADQILWNTRFVDILSRTADGQRLIDYTRFHDVI